jgi:alpha-L-fucosidase
MHLTRRSLIGLAAAAGSSLFDKAFPAFAAQTKPQQSEDTSIAEGPFQGTRASLENYQVPEWFRDAKFGIWAHWGPQSAVEAGDWYARNMYIQGSEQYNYHVQRFGHPSKFGFKDTIPAWKAEKFDPTALMQLYKKAGAKYFMSMGVHHDNFDMWNSRYHSWNAAQMGPHKDIVGMWREAARNEGLRFGVSEHLWISYKWYSVSHGSDAEGPLAGVLYDGANPEFKDFYIDSDQVWTRLDWNESGIPVSWKRQWFRRIKDLLDHYELDLLYTDGPLPFTDYGYKAVAHLYNLSAKRSGGKVEAVYFSKRDEDALRGTCVLDRERGVLSDISPRPWQTDTCIGDWHYKLGETYKTPKRVIDLLVDIVARNGNLLLNFPLPASGELDLEEREILAGITEWMATNGDAIFATRPWKIAGEGPPAVADSASFNEKARRDLTAADIRFTVKGRSLYAFVMGWPDYQVRIQSLAQDTALRVGKIENVELLGDSRKLTWQQTRDGLTIQLPPEAPTKYAVAFRVTGAV